MIITNKNNIENELGKYNLIKDYYKKNPYRIESNLDYLISITDRLVEISFSDQEISEKLQKESDNLLKFFAEKSNYI